jgi:hypothetical protein
MQPLVHEIICQTIGNLSPQIDMQTLSSCALANSSFHSASRAVVFGELCISPTYMIHNRMKRFTVELSASGGYFRMQTRPNVLDGLLDILARSPNHCASMIHKLYLDIIAFPQPDNCQSVLDFLRLLPALRHLIIFDSDGNPEPASRTFQLLLSGTNSDLNVLPAGESISLSLRTVSEQHSPLDWLVNLGILSTSVPTNHLPTVMVKQITFIRTTGSQPTTHYKLYALEMEFNSHSTSTYDIPSLLGADFATTLEHLHISRLAREPSVFFLMRLIYLFRRASPYTQS